MSDSVVVVGVDGSPEAEAALAFAVEEARLRGARLRVVCAWEPVSAAYAGEAFSPTPDVFLETEHNAEDVVRAVLERVRAEGVDAEGVVEEGRAAAVLVEQAQDAVLLVAGSRGLGAAKRLLLGSVSTELVHHARCPVAIVPSQR